MSVFISNIKEALEQELITEGQALYIICRLDNVNYPIEALQLLELTKLKFIINNRVGKILLTGENVKLKLKGTVKARYDSQISEQIPKQLCRLLCVKNEDTGTLKLIGDDDDINTTADKFLGGEGLVAYHFLIFLFMFPLRGSTNKKWEKHFSGRAYTGARLRVRSKKAGKLFLSVARNKDMGIFLYGTYLFIKSCIQEDRTYVKTIQNYMLEYEDWYVEAEAIIKKARTAQELFRSKASREGRMNVSI